MERPTLQQLHYLVALDEHRHFGRAAAATFVSQPALSVQIRELERRVGSQLVERTGRQVLFTPEGVGMAQRARAVLASVDELVQVGQQHHELTGSLTVGVIPTMAPYLLLHVVDAVAHYPDVVLRLAEQRTEHLLTSLRAGELDLALLAGPVEGNDVHTFHLADDPFVLANSSRRIPFPPRSRLRIDDLLSENVLLLEDGHCLRDQALSVCSLANSPTIDVGATSLATLTQMVAAGLGVTLLPASSLCVEARAGAGISIRRFQSPAPQREIVLAWRASSPRHHHYVTLAQQLKPMMKKATAIPGWC
jgi:LysR family transcriptional regulator, hydrogen peroxide-inducible genes activator